jgi:predicted alpha/beta superfamily hydrolase
MVEAFFTVVVYGEGGFPIREEGQLGVAVYDPGLACALTEAGDFNGWDPGQLPLIQPVAGFPFYYRISPIVEPLPRTLYKFVCDGSTWFADPKARRFGWDQNGEYSLAEAGTSVSHLERWPDFSDPNGALKPRDLYVYVPAGTASPEGYPVLYAHDGQNLFDPNAFWGGWRAQQAADTTIAAGTVRPFLLVGVANTADRMDEYTHVPDDLGQGAPVGGRGAEYLELLTGAIKPFIDGRYPTRPEAGQTGILGSSLGGLISFYAVQVRPEVFGHGASMSGTFGWGAALGNPRSVDLVQQLPPLGHPLYLDSGGSPQSGDDNYFENVELRDELLLLGWVQSDPDPSKVDLYYIWAADAQHNEAAWAARLPNLLSAWFPGP